MEIKANVKLIKESKGMTDKLQCIDHLSVSTVNNDFCTKMRTCGKDNDKTICRYCYAVKAERYNGKNDTIGYKYIGELLSSRILTKKELQKNAMTTNILLRINKIGELINMCHLINVMNVAKINKHSKIALFTKRADLIIEYKKLNKVPKNVVLIYSNPIIDGTVTNKTIIDNFDKIFNVISTGLERVNCNDKASKSSKCILCQKCYKKAGVKDIFEALRK